MTCLMFFRILYSKIHSLTYMDHVVYVVYVKQIFKAYIHLGLFDVRLIDIAPFPILTWLKRLYDRMISRLEMFCCMLIRRTIAATYMITCQT